MNKTGTAVNKVKTLLKSCHDFNNVFTLVYSSSSFIHYVYKQR